MHRTVRRAATGALATALVAAGGLAASPPVRGTAPTPATAAAAAPTPAVRATIDWKLSGIRVVFQENATAPPAASLYLAFTSLAVRDAVRRSLQRGTSSEVAAIAQAAHDVLAEYFPTSAAGLDADLTASLAGVPDGAAERKGVRIGRRAADDMIASRVGDGRNDTSVVYQRAPAPGVWQPPATGMALAWLGFVDPVVLDTPVPVDGPDPLESAQYAADYEEVRVEGRVDAPPEARSDEEEAIALFFNSGSTRMYHEALCRYLMTNPLGLRATLRLFALMDAAAADTFIQTWRLKYDIGFWRPFQAIAGAADDRNDATSPEANWAPLVPNPAYADYTSGHAAATSSFAGAVRAVLGDDIPLVLMLPTGASRSYATLSDIEHDALNARIWGGLHFRDAMDDGYRLGHITVARVRAQLR